MKYKYYNGEKDSPFKDDKSSLFWQLEQQFFDRTHGNPSFIIEYKRDAKHYIKEHPNEHNILTDKSTDIETKAFLIYALNMLEKWCPYDMDVILDY